MLLFRIATLALVLTLSGLYASPISISFETLPGLDGILGTLDDTSLTACNGYCFNPQNEYASTGVRSTTGELYYRSGNHFLSSVPLTALFSVPVFDVGIQVLSSYWNVKLTAYNAADQVVGSQTLINSSPGSQEISGKIALTAATPISKIFIAEASCTPGTSCNPIVVLDNLQFTVQDSVPSNGSAVPEPSSQLAGVLGTALVVSVRKHRKSAVPV